MCMRSGWTGASCQDSVDDCVGVSCSNGGTCVDGVNDFTCDCTAGWEGELCADEIGCISEQRSPLVDEVGGIVGIAVAGLLVLGFGSLCFLKVKNAGKSPEGKPHIAEDEANDRLALPQAAQFMWIRVYSYEV
ncbi:unnamed protein product [Chrysoparadoxa australica]